MSNSYDPTRGNVTDRQRRKLYLLETYVADVVLVQFDYEDAPRVVSLDNVRFYEGGGDCVILPACRCYRCGKPLSIYTVTVDRIKPGYLGGTYRRDNIRPSCSDCANKQGAELSVKARNRVPVVRPRVRQLAARHAQADGGSEGPVQVPDVRPSGAGNLRLNGPVEG